MKYEYKFRKETITVDIDESDYNILIALDHEEYNLNRKHDRRYPLSIEVALDGSFEERDNGRLRRRRTRIVNGAVCDNPIAADDCDTLGDLISSKDHLCFVKNISQKKSSIFPGFYHSMSREKS